MKKVLVFGTYDGIHKGHLYFLNQAKEYGEYLVVVVARDETVKKIKAKAPLKNEIKRIKELQEYKIINEIRLGDKNNPYKVLKEIKPDVICLGYDQKSFTKNLSNEIKKLKLKTRIFRIKSYKPAKFHSSIIASEKKE